jgi:hypothetical protein
MKTEKNQIMKTLATFDPLTQSLHITFDSDAQKAFARATAKIADFLAAERKLANTPASSAQGIISLEAGLDTLARLGNHPSGQEMKPEALKSGLDAACYTALYCLTAKKPVEPIGQVIVMLATITPFRVTNVSLPPASEVFDVHKVAQTAWNAFEVIRLWLSGTSSHLFTVPLPLVE